jgi:hypothetical protein
MAGAAIAAAAGVEHRLRVLRLLLGAASEPAPPALPSCARVPAAAPAPLLPLVPCRAAASRPPARGPVPAAARAAAVTLATQSRAKRSK